MPETSIPQPAGTTRDATESIANQAVRRAVIELHVRNHPGTLSHVAGLFARRGFNLEALRCAPQPGDSSCSRMLLLVEASPRLEQLERQLRRLHDVLEVHHRAEVDASWFAIPT